MSADAQLIAGRVLMAAAFIGPALSHLADSVNRRVATEVAMALVEVVAGLALAAGRQLRWIALAVAAFLVVDAFLAHDFWNAVPSDHRNQLLHFFKNLALAGAFSMLK